MTKMRRGLKKALVLIRNLREEFWNDLIIPGSPEELNQELEEGRKGCRFP